MSMEYENTTLEEAAKTVLNLRRYAPYRFGGKWFLATIGTTTFVRRSVDALKKRAAKAGVSELTIATI
jgi:hypothetical protein